MELRVINKKGYLYTKRYSKMTYRSLFYEIAMLKDIDYTKFDLSVIKDVDNPIILNYTSVHALGGSLKYFYKQIRKFSVYLYKYHDYKDNIIFTIPVKIINIKKRFFFFKQEKIKKSYTIVITSRVIDSKSMFIKNQIGNDVDILLLTNKNFKI